MTYHHATSHLDRDVVALLRSQIGQEELVALLVTHTTGLDLPMPLPVHKDGVGRDGLLRGVWVAAWLVPCQEHAAALVGGLLGYGGGGRAPRAGYVDCFRWIALLSCTGHHSHHIDADCLACTSIPKMKRSF